jgi:LysM repeat protein
MNTKAPVNPYGLLDRQSKSKSSIRVAIFLIVSFHAVLFAGLLIQGCKRDETKIPTETAGLPVVQNERRPDPNPLTESPEAVPGVTNSTPESNTVPLRVSDALLAVPTPTNAVPLGIKEYTVVKGDTLFKIARANGVSLSAITKANSKVEPSKLKAGQKIQIPTSAASSPADLGFSEPTKTGAGSVHVVKAGESLSKIARQYGTTIKAIEAANNLKSTRVMVGQKLRLPVPSQTIVPAESAEAGPVPKVASTQPSQITR